MKKTFLSIGLILISLTGCDKEDNFGKLPCNYIDFKYYNSDTYFLGDMSGDYILIGSDSLNSDKSIQDLIKSKDYFDQKYSYTIRKEGNYKYKYFAIKLRKTFDCAEITWMINDLEKNSIVDFVHYTIQTDNCQNMIWEPIGELCVDSYSNIFYVKVKDTNDLLDLTNTLIETKTMIRDQNQFMSEWFSIYADKNSEGDALEMANYFYETGLFVYSEPDIIKIAVE